jgi:hypothetical protein
LLVVRAQFGVHATWLEDSDAHVPPGEGLLDGRLGLRAVGDVCLHHQRGAAGLFDLGGEVVQTVLAAGNKCDGGAVLREPASGGSTDPAARAGDE